MTHLLLSSANNTPLVLIERHRGERDTVVCWFGRFPLSQHAPAQITAETAERLVETWRGFGLRVEEVAESRMRLMGIFG